MNGGFLLPTVLSPSIAHDRIVSIARDLSLATVRSSSLAADAAVEFHVQCDASVGGSEERRGEG